MSAQINRWVGGASITQQVSTITLNDDFADDENTLTVTMTNLNTATTQTVVIDPSGTVESTIALALKNALAASTDTLFTAVTWTQASSVVTGTAVNPGVPFEITSAATDGTGTCTIATSAANSGPHDYGTAANFDTTTEADRVPTAGDFVRILDGSYDILYNLNQSSVTLGDLMVGPHFRGGIGDNVNASPLRIAGTPVWFDGSGCRWARIHGDLDTFNVLSTSSGPNALHISSDIDNLYATGRAIRRITIENSTTLDAAIFNCPGAIIKVGTGVTTSGTVKLISGNMTTGSTFGTLRMNGGRCRIYSSSSSIQAVPTNVKLDGGELLLETGGTIASFIQDGGTCLLSGSTADALDFSTTFEVNGGTFDEGVRGGDNNVTYPSGGVTVRGGGRHLTSGKTYDPTT